MASLIGGSLLLLLVASITLGFGWVGANSTFLWISIMCSAGTAVALATAYSRSRQLAEAAQRRARPARRSPRARTTRGTGARTSTGFATQAMARPDTRTRERVSPNDGEVVAIPERRKFHRPDCRYARVRGATKMTRSAARRKNFDACGICKP